LKTVKLKICRGRKTQLVVSNQVVTNPWCGLAVIFCGLISLLIGRETINIPEILSGVHGFTGMIVIGVGNAICYERGINKTKMKHKIGETKLLAI